MIDAGERRLLGAIRGWGRIRQSRAVLLVVERAPGTEGIVGGELRGGRWLRVDLGAGAMVVPDRV